MATTLTRPETRRPALPAAPGRSPITLLVVIAALATAVLVGQVAGPAASDTSHEVAERARQMALGPTGDSSFDAEFARQTALGARVVHDESHHVAEQARMTSLAPAADDSFERNEAARQARLGG